MSIAITDSARLQALEATALLDSDPEDSFDRYTRLASRLLDAPVSLVSLVDTERQFFLSSTGLPDPLASRRETPLSHSFCRHVVDLREPLIVEDAREHPLVRDNPAIEDLNVTAYLGIPLVTATGQVLGSFCAIDERPRQWSEEHVATMVDLAAAVITQIELRTLSSAALSNFHALQRLEGQRDEMVHMLVHDLRNPLSSMLAALDMLEILPGIDERHRKYLARARTGGRTLLELVNEILTVSKSEAGKLLPDLALVPPQALIDRAVGQLAQLAATAGIALTARVAPRTPACRADIAMIERVLVNLIGNALAHTPRHGNVEIEARSVVDGAVRFTVRDTGSGVPAAELERIFDKFEQASGKTERTRQSTGLGLAFCRSVVTSHGGRIWAESEPGRGARFHFTIPAA